MEDILSLYQRPYDPLHPLVCMDELTKQLLKDTKPVVAAKPGKVARQDYEYVRGGTGNVFMYFEPMTGQRHAEVSERKTKVAWALSMQHMADDLYPSAEKITVVLDNLSTHKPESFYQAFPPDQARRLVERFEFHYTPVHGSWLNMAEIALSLLGRECLSRRLADHQALQQEVATWELESNRKAKAIDWRFTSKEARIKLKRLYPTVVHVTPVARSVTGH